MTLPSTFLARLDERARQHRMWVEVEGWPWAFGTFSASASWFASRITSQRFEGIFPLFVRDKWPLIPPNKVDHLDGRVEVGSCILTLSDLEDTLAGLTAVRRTDGHLRLAADVTAAGADNEWTTTGDTDAWPASGIAYIRGETVSFTRTGNTFSVARGRYRSRTEAMPAGEILSLYPRRVHGRRVWLRWGVNATTDTSTGAIVLFAGKIQNYSWTDRGRTMVLDCDDSQALIKSTLFERTPTQIWWDALLDARERVPVARADWPVTLAVQTPATGVNPNVPRVIFAGIAMAVGVSSTPDTMMFVTTEGEIVRLRDPRAGEGPGDTPTANLVMTIDRGIGGFRPSGNTLTLHAPVEILEGHPLAIVRDVLVQEYGISSETNLPSFARLIAATPSLYVWIPVIGSVDNGREFLIQQCMKPFGFYFRTEADGRIGVATFGNTLTIDELLALPDIDSEDVSEIGDWKIDTSTVVRTLHWSASPRIGDGRMELLDEAAIAIHDNGEPPDPTIEGVEVKIESHGLHGGRGTGEGFTLAGTREADGAEAAGNLAGKLSARFARPTAVLSVACKIDRKAGLVPGDFVMVTLPHQPSQFADSRGIDAEPMEIVQRSLDLRAGLVRFELAQTGISEMTPRYFAPAADIASVDGDTLTLHSHRYTLSDGDVDDGDAFEVGDVVRLYSADHSQKSAVATVVSASGTEIVLDAFPSAWTPESGQWLKHAEREHQPESVLRRWAFRADTDGEFTDGDPAHRLAVV